MRGDDVAEAQLEDKRDAERKYGHFWPPRRFSAEPVVIPADALPEREPPTLEKYLAAERLRLAGIRYAIERSIFEDP